MGAGRIRAREIEMIIAIIRNARRQDEGGILTTSGHIVSSFQFL